jgi:hypothetical protein
MRDKLYLGELNGLQLDFATGSFTDIYNVTGHIRNAVLNQTVADGITGFAPSSEAVWDFVTGVSGYLDDHNSLYALSSEASGSNAANVVLTPEDGNTTTKVTFSGQTGITVSESGDTIFIGHEDTSNQANSINTDGNVIQSVSFDDYGHVTVIGTTDLDNRYLQVTNSTLDTVTTNGNITTNDIQVGDVTTSKLTITGDGGGNGTIYAPATLFIDPATHDNIAGTVVVLGDLDVRGTTTFIHSTDVQIGDTNIILATGATEAQANGAGFTISGTEGTYASFTYSSSNDRFVSSLPIQSTGGFLGNATTATSLETPISVSITGDATGIATNFDGSANLSVHVEVIDGSHDHIIDNISGLQAALDSKQYTITGAATSITGDNLTIDRALISDSFGKVAVSAVTTTELEYLTGLASQLQPQLDSKVDKITQVIAGSGLIEGGNLSGDVTLSVGQGDGMLVSGDLIAVDSTVVRTSRTLTAGNGLTGGGDLSADRSFTTVSDQGHLNNIKIAEDQVNIGAGTNVTYGGVLVARARSTSATPVSLSESGAGTGDIIAVNADSTLTYEGIVAVRNEDANNADGAESAAWKVVGVLERDSDSVNMILSQVTQIAKGANASNWTISLAAGTNGLEVQGNGETAHNLVWSATLSYNVITA